MKSYTFVITQGLTTWKEIYVIHDNTNPKDFITDLLDNFNSTEEAIYGYRAKERFCINFFETTLKEKTEGEV